ncbi:hypothetical protein [Primorskyibacter sp. S87]|uniref:hypothetical protein n=1 Tax=Primorskyibacter sp. S87 TaxID=3415126 RepID=UPI003C7AC219
MIRALSVIFLIASPVAAQDNRLTRSFELPSHRALMSVKGELAPFTTDGCSGGLSAGWQLVADQFPDFAAAHQGQPPWESCCVTHDRAYHNAGGSETAEDSYEARLTADMELETCVNETGEPRITDLALFYDVSEDLVRDAYDTIAGAMYLAVRFGGGPCSGLPWRWGYGFEACSILDATTGPANE